MLALWQAGLTISIHAQVVTDPAELAALSLKASNDVFVLEPKCGDSFPLFAMKIAWFLQPVKKQPINELMQYVKDVRFQGVLVRKRCLLGALKYVAEIDGDTHDLVVRFERRFWEGRLHGQVEPRDQCAHDVRESGNHVVGKYFDVFPIRPRGTLPLVGTGARGGDPGRGHDGVAPQED